VDKDIKRTTFLVSFSMGMDSMVMAQKDLKGFGGKDNIFLGKLP